MSQALWRACVVVGATAGSALVAGVQATPGARDLDVAVAQTRQVATPDTPQVFRAGTDVVRVDVAVRDGRRPLTTLTATDFEVLDNGVRQQVTEVSYGTVPIDVTVVLDTSRSVTGEMLENLRRAILQMMGDLGDDDRLKLVGFSTRIGRVVDFTADTSLIEDAIMGAAAGGGSSIRDAASVALVSASDPDSRQLVMLFTDGADSSSTTSEGTLWAVMQRSNAVLSMVIPERLQAINLSVEARQYLSWLEDLAEASGGQMIRASGNLTETFQRALGEFRSSYVLYFSPTGVDRDGYHELEVRVPRHRGATIRARRGYFSGTTGDDGYDGREEPES